MGFGKKLDAAGRARWKKVSAIVLILIARAVCAFAADDSTEDKISAVKKLYDEQRWEEVVAPTQDAPATPADFGLYRGLALAHLQRWEEAQRVFEASLARNPGDARIMTELAGLAYRQKQFK